MHWRSGLGFRARGVALTWAVLLEVGGVLGVVHADLTQNWAVHPAPEPGLVLGHVQPAHWLSD